MIVVLNQSVWWCSGANCGFFPLDLHCMTLVDIIQSDLRYFSWSVELIDFAKIALTCQWGTYMYGQWAFLTSIKTVWLSNSTTLILVKVGHSSRKYAWTVMRLKRPIWMVGQSLIDKGSINFLSRHVSTCTAHKWMHRFDARLQDQTFVSRVRMLPLSLAGCGHGAVPP